MISRLCLSHLPKRIAPVVTPSRCLHITAINRSATLRDAVARDHADLEQYYDQYKSSLTKDEKAKWGNAFVWEITRHAFGEELIVFPGKAALSLT
jgi:hypothetical protein